MYSNVYVDFYDLRPPKSLQNIITATIKVNVIEIIEAPILTRCSDVVNYNVNGDI